MSTIKFANTANSTLAGNINNSTTSITVAAGTGARFPTLGAGQFFDIVLEDRRVTPIIREICRCTARSVDTFTVTRGTGGTTAVSFSSGATVSNRITAEGLAALLSDAIAGQRYLGLSDTVPETRPDGTALVAGDQYWDTVKTNQFVWTGAAWALTIRPKTDFDVGGDLDVTGTFVAGGNATLGGNLHVEGTLLVDGATTLTGAVSVAGAMTLDGAFKGVSTLPGSFAGALSVAGASSITGNQYLGGSQTVGGGITATGTIDGGAIKIAGHDIAVFEDVSGTNTMQKFPTGNILKWGFNQTSSGKFFPNAQVDVEFDPPFPNACVAVFCTAFSAGSFGSADRFSSFFGVYSPDKNGFKVVSFNKVSEPEGPVGFYWFAIGG